MKNFITEKERQTEIIADVDVLVVGGGPSGIGAAIGAAKAGASTMIIEALGSFGGMWTNGLIITLAGFNNWLRPYQRCVDGVMGEWLVRAEKMGGAENNRSWVLNSDPEILKYTADQMLLDYDVKCMLHTWAADVLMEENRIKGVLVENVEGREIILAKNIIDCTGNGDIMVRSGESWSISPELQPCTMGFVLADVDPKGEFEDETIIPIGPEPGYLEGKTLDDYQSARRDIVIDRKKIRDAFEKGEIPKYGGPWFGGVKRRFPWVNTTRAYGSGVNIEDLTKAEMSTRKDAFALVEFYKKELEGFENSWIVKTGATLGIRETRQLDGVYKLTGQDLIDDTKFEDSIAVCSWPIDIHPSKGEVGQHLLYLPLPFQIPLRSLFPKRVENLIVAGRCISADRKAMAATRVGATCGAIGHAAGVTAAISSKLTLNPREIDPKLVQNELLKQKAIITRPE